jgi:putative (di)nucleoside polyphosphate hydrolase
MVLEKISPEKIKKLPYRKSVSCIVFRDGQFLLVQLIGWPANWWKFPQGGIEPGESPETAAQRELLEELGNKEFTIVARSRYSHRYDWPDDSIKKADNRWRGQIQKFVLAKYIGSDEEIKINKKEIQQYKWVDLKELLLSIEHNDQVFFNYRQAIKKVLKEFDLI